MNSIDGVDWRQRDDPRRLAHTLAEDVASALRAAIDARGRATLVVSGGGTPVPMFECLSSLTLDWSAVTVTLADERITDPEGEQSNERMVRATLLQNAAAAASFVSLHDAGLRSADGAGGAGGDNAPAGHPATQAAVARIEARLAVMALPFDVLLLGMGDDGHTASLFPDAPELERAMRTDAGLDVVGRLHITRPPSQPLVRLSMSARQLVDARRVWLHLVGQGKRDLLERASRENTLPIARVLAAAAEAGCERAVYWAP